MEINFTDGEAGFFEAAALAQIAEHARDLDPANSALMQVLERLNRAADQHRQRPEFEILSAPPAPVHGDDVSWLRSWFGPSRQERRLSAQRIAALERAERAERSAFEALAETTRVARERDDAVARMRALEASSRDADSDA